jgi:GDP-L-fucose synthase
MKQSDKIYVAGHRGMVGSAIVRALGEQGFVNIITRTSASLDLRKQSDVERFFKDEQPDYVFLAAARVGGIHANNVYRAEFLYDNLMIQNNIIHQSYQHNVKKLLFLGSSCIYPKFSLQPIREEYLLNGPLEPTNEPYAIAKIAGIKMCEAYRSQYGCNFISAMPTNLYGINDNYDLENSHVLPALLRKCHEAKMEGASEMWGWGSGQPRREFLFADDLADACLFLMNHYNEGEPINVGLGVDISIADLAHLIREVVGFNGAIRFNPSKPDGTPRKLLNVDKLHSLGWKHSIPLIEGLHRTYADFLNKYDEQARTLVA